MFSLYFTENGETVRLLDVSRRGRHVVVSRGGSRPFWIKSAKASAQAWKIDRAPVQIAFETEDRALAVVAAIKSEVRGAEQWKQLIPERA